MYDHQCSELSCHVQQDTCTPENAAFLAVLCAGRAPGAGTDADVSVELTGTSGTFGPHMLPASIEAFQEGCRDSFRCVCQASMHH